MTINAFLEAAKPWQTDNVSNEQLAIAASNAAKEIEELRTLCQTYFYEGSDSLTRKDIERIESRIRELVGDK